MATTSVRRLNKRYGFALAIVVSLSLAIACVTAASASSPSPDQQKSETVPGTDRKAFVAFGLPRTALTAEKAAKIPDLYSSNLTEDRNYGWNRNGKFRLVVDRIFPLHQVMELGANDWPKAEKMEFGSDPENFSLTSNAANLWKGTKTPRDMLALKQLGTFSWTDKCAEGYEGFTSNGNCIGLPEDFNSCGYAERYSSVAARFHLVLPSEDSYALRELSKNCS